MSVSQLALEHGVNANLLRKWIRKRAQTRSLSRLPPPAFMPAQIERTADRTLSRHSSVGVVSATCDEVRGSQPKRAALFSAPAKVNASLPNGVKETLECGDVDALTAAIGAPGHVQTGR